VDPGGPNEHELPGLVDDEPLPAATLVRIDTTGGGGWGDPLEREPELVALDVLQGKVSPGSAREDYGVVFTSVSDQEAIVDDVATRDLRASRTGRPRSPAFFDRGPGYCQLSGRDYADVDLL
jgi:N-methylhydantoinase B